MAGRAHRGRFFVPEEGEPGPRMAGIFISGGNMERQIIPKDLASEALNSEDFNRLNETVPRLMRVLAEGAGTSVCTLRKMAHEGRLTSAVLLGTTD